MSNQTSIPAARKILICEDELIIGEDLAASLRARGYEVPDIVSSGEEAVRVALELKPDLILMDIKLHGKIDGIGAVEKIRGVMDL